MGFELHLRQLQNPVFLGLNKPKTSKFLHFTISVLSVLPAKLGLKLGRIS